MELNTIEKFLLLALHPKKSGFISSMTYINTGFIGSMFLELALLDKISIKKRRVFVKNNDKIVAYPLLNEVLLNLKKRDKPRTLKSWILSLYRRRASYLWVVLEEMETKGLVRIQNKHFMKLISYRKIFLTHSSAQQELIQQLKEHVKSQNKLSNQDKALLGLVEACKLYPNFSSRRLERKELEKQIKQSISDDSPPESTIDEAVRKAIKIIIATMYLSVYYVNPRKNRNVF